MVSVLILTKNEEKDLPACLASVSWCDDIHVFDSFSDDGTVAIALNAVAKITQRKFDNWSAHQNWGLANIPFKYNWVFYLDADERVSPELKESLLNFDSDNVEAVAYEIQRRDFAWNGTWLKNAQISPYYLRLFRPDKMRYERLVNPISIPDGPVKKLNGYLDHYPFSKGFRAWWSRHLGYADMEAVMRLQDHGDKKRFSLKKAVLSRDFAERRYHQKGLFYKMPGRPFVKWLYMVIARRSFLDGMTGVTYSTLQAIYEYFIILKTRELLLLNKQTGGGEKTHNRGTRSRRILMGCFSLCYSAGLVYLLFFARRRWNPSLKRTINIVPFREKIAYWQAVGMHVSNDKIEFYKDFLGNILLFVPFPFLLLYLLGMKSYRTLLFATMAFSLFAETMQFVFDIGVADIDDLLLNTIGGCIGLFIMRLFFLKKESPSPLIGKPLIYQG